MKTIKHPKKITPNLQPLRTDDLAQVTGGGTPLPAITDDDFWSGPKMGTPLPAGPAI